MAKTMANISKSSFVIDGITVNLTKTDINTVSFSEPIINTDIGGTVLMDLSTLRKIMAEIDNSWIFRSKDA